MNNECNITCKNSLGCHVMFLNSVLINVSIIDIDIYL